MKESKYEIEDVVNCIIAKPVLYGPGISRLTDLSSTIKIIGKEYGSWLRTPQWIYTFTNEHYAFTLRATESALENCKIRIVGQAAKVLTENEKIATK